MISVLLLVIFLVAYADIPIYGAPGSKTGEAQRFPTTNTGNGYWVLGTLGSTNIRI